MSSRVNVLIVIGLGILGLLVWQAFGSVPKVSPERWEYKIADVPDTAFTSQTNDLGHSGWELVSARRASDGSDTSPTYSYEMIFKRRMQASGSPSDTP
jgi:hypothetical protein